MGFVLHGPESVFFKQFLPSPELEPWAERLWVTTPGSPAERPEVRVAPDARTELILRVVSGGVSAAVGGAMSRHRAVPNDGRSIHVGLTLRAHAAAPLFHLNAAELTNETPELAAVAARACRSLPPPDPSSTQSCVEFLEALVRHRIREGAREPDPTMAHVAQRLANPVTRIRGLIAELGWSDRHLRRRCLESIGLSPKRILQIHRMQRALTLAHLNHRNQWADLALSAGYYDQPHMIHEFRRLLGLTPPQSLRY